MKKFAVFVLGLTFLCANHGYSMEDEHEKTSVLYKSGGAQILPSKDLEEENSKETTATLDPIYWSVDERAKYVGLGFFGGGLCLFGSWFLCFPV